MINPLSYSNYILDYSDERCFSDDFKKSIYAEHVIVRQRRNFDAFTFGISGASPMYLNDCGHNVKNKYQVFHGYGQDMAYSKSIINAALQNVLRNLG